MQGKLFLLQPVIGRSFQALYRQKLTGHYHLCQFYLKLNAYLSQLATLVSTFPFPRRLIQPFIRNEAVISSRIEGTRASLVDLYTYETAQLSFFERTDDVREVFNYVRATDYGLERLKTLPVSLRLIRELHEKLMENVRGGSFNTG